LILLRLIGFRHSNVSVLVTSSPDFGGFLVSGQPSARRELGDPIDREVSQAPARSSGLSYVERAIELAQFGLAEVRRSAFSLQPTIIEESGLIDALQKLVERSNVPGRLRGNFHWPVAVWCG